MSNKARRRTIVSDIAFVLIIIIVIFSPIAIAIYHGESSTVHEYALSELDDDIYGIYTVVSSSIPAQNYEMITLCANDQVYTFKGTVNIHYSESKPKLILTDKNYVNSDIMDIYVPHDSIEFAANVGIGSRR